MTDRQLIQQYIRESDQTAFTELVRRHAGMVCATAKRLAKEDADDVSQAVFLLLARKANQLLSRESVAGWLYETTRFCSSNARRIAVRNLRKTEVAKEVAMSRQESTAGELSGELVSTLDEGLSRLPAAQRDAILLRYVEGHSLAAAAIQLGISDAALAKRAERGIDALRSFFGAKGFTTTAIGLTACLAAQLLPVTDAQAAVLSGAATSQAVVSPTVAALTVGGKIAVAKVLLAALALLTIGTAIVVPITLDKPNRMIAATAPTQSAPATVPSTQPATVPVGNPTSEGATTMAKDFAAALRDRNTDRIAELMFGMPSEKAAAAKRYVAELRDGPYARYPERLMELQTTSTTMDVNNRFLQMTVSASPPTNADLRRMAITLSPAGSVWFVREATYTDRPKMFENTPSAASGNPLQVANIDLAKLKRAQKLYTVLMNRISAADIPETSGRSQFYHGTAAIRAGRFGVIR